MIKGYLDLNNDEKLEIINFIKLVEDKSIELDEVEKRFNAKINGYGKGSLFYFEDNKVIGRIEAVLEVCKELGTAYVHHLQLINKGINKKRVIEELVKEVISVINKYNPEAIFLKIDKEYISIFSELGYDHDYPIAVMYLDDREIKENTLELIALNNDNKEKYLEVINNSFSDMPHGTYHYMCDIDEYINKANNSNQYFMVSKNECIIGFINIEIKDNIGMFDIGLVKESRGKGYGKELLETAIDFLNHESVENIELIVVKKNTRAYNMYTNRGFKEKSILNYWAQIS